MIEGAGGMSLDMEILFGQGHRMPNASDLSASDQFRHATGQTPRQRSKAYGKERRVTISFPKTQR